MAVAEPTPATDSGPQRGSVEELFHALESALLGYALRLLPEADVAEEIVQEAFMRLHVQFNQVREPRRWLYRTVHNLALNHKRDRARIVPLHSAGQEQVGFVSEAIDGSGSPDEELARAECISLVRGVLLTLDARSRELIMLKFNDELSYKAISERTGLTVGHVGYLLHHALKNLAAALAKAGFVP